MVRHLHSYSTRLAIDPLCNDNDKHYDKVKDNDVVQGMDVCCVCKVQQQDAITKPFGQCTELQKQFCRNISCVAIYVLL